MTFQGGDKLPLSKFWVITVECPQGRTADDIFKAGDSESYYVLIGGRWFIAPSLEVGPWTYEPPTRLPATFLMIPDYSPKADVLVAVPGTPQAKEALIANQIPQTATISRTAAQITVKYDGGQTSSPFRGRRSPTP